MQAREVTVGSATELDALMVPVPGWLEDVHPDVAGWNSIADETAKFLAQVICGHTAGRRPAVRGPR